MTSGVFPLPSARAPAFPEFPGSGAFDELGSLYARYQTVFSSHRDQKEERLQAAVRSGKKAGASSGKSMPGSQDPSLRSVMLGESADRRVGEKKPQKTQPRGGKLESFRRKYSKFGKPTA